MADRREEVRKLLETSLLTAKSMIENGLIVYDEGISIMKCIGEICRRFGSDEYMEKAPSGRDIEEIDQMLLPLGDRLQEAGSKSCRNTIRSILRMLICGAGEGHRILTPEEQKNRVEVLLHRNSRVQLWQEAVDTSEKLDQQLILMDDLMKKDRILRRKTAEYQEKADRIRTLNPEAMEDIAYYFDPADMCEDAVIYLDLMTSLNRIKEDLELDEKHIAACRNMVMKFQTELGQLLDQIGNPDSDLIADSITAGADMPVDGLDFDLIDYQK